MKNYELADLIYDSAKQTLSATDSLDYDTVFSDNLNDFLHILDQLCQVAQQIGIEIDTVAVALETKTEAILEDRSQFEKFCREYKNVLKQLLLKVMQYRNYVCIIKRNDPVPGLASHIITNLGQIVHALDQGYIPVIDTMNCENCFTSLSVLGQENIWEKYFKQPFGGTLNDASNSPKTANLDGIPAFYPSYKMDDLDNPVLTDFWREVTSKYLRLSDRMESKIKEVKKTLSFDEKRTIGIICRGTDYTGMKPYNHPVQPSVEKVIKDVKDLMQKYHCEYCFLATEDELIFQRFKDEFGDYLLFTQDILYSRVGENTLNSFNEQEKIDADLKNEEYLVSLKLLSECTCLIGGRTSGAVVANLFSGGFEYFHLYDEGRYQIDDVITLNRYVV